MCIKFWAEHSYAMGGPFEQPGANLCRQCSVHSTEYVALKGQFHEKVCGTIGKEYIKGTIRKKTVAVHWKCLRYFIYCYSVLGKPSKHSKRQEL
jgi:hypothetical protein